MRRGNPVSIGELWEGFLRENPAVSRGIDEARAAELWVRAAGPAIASLTGSVAVRGGVMEVKMISSVARHEVFIRREEFARAVNRELGRDVIRQVIVK